MTINKNLFKTVIEYAPIGQLFMAAWWDMFNKKKRETLIQSIADGKSWRFAYEDAKNIK